MTLRGDRWRAFALLVVAFGTGAAAGVAADRSWWRPRVDGAPVQRAEHPRPAGREAEAEAIPTPLEQLGLSPVEQQRLHAIARRWRPQAAEAVARIRPIVAELENGMFAEMLCVLPAEKQDRYLADLRAGGADTTLIDKRFRLVRQHRCPPAGADSLPR